MILYGIRGATGSTNPTERESTMPYRFPIVEGDRVAVAPHTDLWMQGHRFGIVTSLSRVDWVEGRFYFVDLKDGRNVTLNEEDLLGAVNAVPGQYKPGSATSSTDPDCDEFREFGSCIHSDHMMQAGR